MFKITIENENGVVAIVPDVLDYDFVDEFRVQDISDKNFRTELSTDEVKDVQSRIQSLDHLPEFNELYEMIDDVISERE